MRKRISMGRGEKLRFFICLKLSLLNQSVISLVYRSCINEILMKKTKTRQNIVRRRTRCLDVCLCVYIIIVLGRITWRRAESQQIAARRCSTEHNTPPGTEVVYRLFRAPTSN